MIEDKPPASSPNIYLERSGKGSREMAERLLAPSTEPLDEYDKEQARIFEDDLCNVPVDDELTIKTLLLKHKGEALEAPAFFAEAFLKGQIHSEDKEGALRQLKTPDDVYAWLAQVSVDASVSAEELRDIAKQSANYYKTEAAQGLLLGITPPDSLLDYQSIAIEPAKSLQFGRAVLVARERLLEFRRQYSLDASSLDGAKRAFTDIYLKRINGLLAADIPVAEFLINQSELIGDEETAAVARRLLPTRLREAVGIPETRDRLYKRLDYIKNGMGVTEDGIASAVDEKVLTGIGDHSQEEQAPLYSAEQKETLLNTEKSGDETKVLFEAILAEAGLLSNEPSDTWSPGRGHRPTDQLFQVVFNPTKDNFAVNGIDGVVMIPRAATTLYRILTVGVHELEHVNQNQADKLLGEELQIGNIKGRRVSMLRETGANISERKAEKALFGTNDPVELNYARAIQSFEAGGDMFEAARAFYDQHQSTSGRGEIASANLAVDRVMRLILAGGTNSQPMSYAEENIMNKELADAPTEVRQRATAITSLDLDDQERLHRFGLLPILSSDVPDWFDIVYRKLKPSIDEVVHQ
jgi:hypothetical protein